MDRFNDALREVCREVGLQCVDLSPLNGREELYVDDVHFTELGAVEVAKHLAAHVGRNWAALDTPPE